MALPTPKHYWTFDEKQGTTAIDAIGQIQVELDRPSWVDGHQGGGVRFNPTDGVSKASTHLTALKPPWTVGFWVKREADAFEDECSTLFFEDPFVIRLEQWKMLGVGITRYKTQDWNTDEKAFAYKTERGRWVYLTLVGTSSGSTLYVDGQPRGSLSFPVDLPLAQIGSRSGSERTSMVLDELRVFDQELTATQVKELYDLSMAIAPKILVAVDGQQVTNNGKRDLGAIAAGQSKSAKIDFTIGTKATVTYTLTKGAVTLVSTLPSATDVPVAPGAMLSTDTLTIAPATGDPVDVKLLVKSVEDKTIPDFAYTVSANGGGTTPIPDPPRPDPVPGPGVVPGEGESGPPGKPLPNDLSVSIGSKTLATGGTYNAGQVTLPMRPKSIDVILHNTTGDVVSLSGATPVVVNGSGFTVESQPPGPNGAPPPPIRNGESSSFKLRFIPNPPAGPKSAEVSFKNSSPGRDPFKFTITGSVQAGSRDREQTIAGSVGYLWAILRPDGKLWVKYMSRGWAPQTLRANQKPIAIEVVDSAGLVVLLDNGELWSYGYGQGQNGSLAAGLWDSVKEAEGCLSFSMSHSKFAYTHYYDYNNRRSAYYNDKNVGSALIALKNDGSFLAPASADMGGGSTTGAFNLPDTIMVRRGYNFSVALKSDGTVRCWGQNNHNQSGGYDDSTVVRPAKLDKLSGIVHISASRSTNYPFGLAVKDDGTVWGWGYDAGCLGVGRGSKQKGAAQLYPNDLKDIKSVFCGNSGGEAFAIDGKGNLWSWGFSNDRGNGVGTLGRKNAPPGKIYPPNLVDLNVDDVKEDEKLIAESVAFDGMVAIVLTKDGTPYWFGGGDNWGRTSVTPVRMIEFTADE